MTSALIARVIPPHAVPGSRPRGRPGIAGTLVGLGKLEQLSRP